MMARLEAKLEANSEKFEVLQSILISRLDINQARTECTQQEMTTKMDMHQEKMEAAVHYIRSELEIIKHLVEDILLCVNQKMQGLHKELSENTETQVDLQAIRTSMIRGQRESWKP
jgi:hypothetical protein